MKSLHATVQAHELIQRLLREGLELREHPERAGARRAWWDDVGAQWRSQLKLFEFGPDSYGAVSLMRTWFVVPPSPFVPRQTLTQRDITLLTGLLETLEADVFDQRQRRGWNPPADLPTPPRADVAVESTNGDADAGDGPPAVESFPAPEVGASSSSGASERADPPPVFPESLRSLYEAKDGAFVVITDAERFRFGAASLAPITDLGRAGMKSLYLDLISGEVGAAGGAGFAVADDRLSHYQCLLILQVLLTESGVAPGALFNERPFTVGLPRERFIKACRVMEPQKQPRTAYRFFPNTSHRYTFVPPVGGYVVVARMDDVTLIGLDWDADSSPPSSH